MNRKGILNLVDRLQGWTQAAVDAEDATINDSTQGEIVEDFATPAPHVATSVLALALVVKAVYLCDLPRFVVSTDERDAVRIAHFERKEEEKGFDAVKSSIHKVSWIVDGYEAVGRREGRTDKYVIGLWARTADLEQLHQVKELTMNVSTNLKFIQFS